MPPRSFVMVLMATWLGVQVADAQPLALSLSSAAAKPNDIVLLDLALQADAKGPAALQWQLEYPASDFESVEVIAGPAAAAAKKTLTCGGNPKGTMCVLFGLADGQVNRDIIGDGVVAQVRLHVSSTPQSDELLVKLVRALGAYPDGQGIMAPDASGTLSVDRSQLATLSELTCEPSWISAPGSTDCVVSLNAPAPAAGVKVTLTANTALLSFPDSVMVMGGSTSRSLTVTAAAVSQRQTVTLNAQAGGSQRAAVLTVSPPIKLTSMICEPTATKPGDAAICTIRLSDAAPPSGAAITVLSSSESLQAPTNVNVRSGQSAPRFRADVSPFAPSQTVSLTANLGNSGTSESISVSAGVRPILILPPPQTAIYGERFEFQVFAADPRGLPVTLSATMLPAGSLVTPDGTFLWTPQLSHRGTHTVRFWAANSNGLATSEELSIHVVDRKAVIDGIVNSASLSEQAACSPGGLASVFGIGITKGPPKAASGTPLPSTLSDVRIKINGDPVPLIFASSTQVNFQCPVLASGSSLTAIVENSFGVSQPVDILMRPASPGIFTLDSTGQGQGSIVMAGRQEWAMIRNAAVPSAPAMPGDYVSIFATGLGPVSDAIVAGQPASTEQLSTVQGHVEALIGGQPSEIQFAGLAPGFVGTYQVNVKVPGNLSTDDQTPVILRLRLPDGTVIESNRVSMAIETK